MSQFSDILDAIDPTRDIRRAFGKWHLYYRHDAFRTGELRDDRRGFVNGDKETCKRLKSYKIRSPRGAKHWPALSLSRDKRGISFAYDQDGGLYLTTGAWLKAVPNDAHPDPRKEESWAGEAQGPDATPVLSRPNDLRPVVDWQLRVIDDDEKEHRTDALHKVVCWIDDLRSGTKYTKYANSVDLIGRIERTDEEVCVCPVLALIAFGDVKDVMASANNPYGPLYGNPDDVRLLMPKRNDW